VGVTHRRPLRTPAADLVIAICTLAAAESVKRNVVPSGALAEIAVAADATRNRLADRLAALIVGGGGGGACVVVVVVVVVVAGGETTNERSEVPAEAPRCPSP
jgi:hypothetical protein